MKRLLRALATTTGLIALLAAGWAVGFASVVSPLPPRERQPSMVFLVYHWPEPCTRHVFDGGERPPVKFELGLAVTSDPDPMYVDFGVDRATFDGLVRERSEWMHDDSLLQPTRLALLYERYRAAEMRTRNADVAHVVFWCAGLIVPPLALLGIGRALRARRASNKM